MRIEREKSANRMQKKVEVVFFCCAVLVRVHVRFIDTLRRVPVCAYGVCKGATEMDKLRDNWSHSNISHLILWPAAAFIPRFSHSLSLAQHRKSSPFIKWHGSSWRDREAQTSEWIVQRTNECTDDWTDHAGRRKGNIDLLCHETVGGLEHLQLKPNRIRNLCVTQG